MWKVVDVAMSVFLVLSLAITSIVAIFLYIGWLHGARINQSLSMPRGIYTKTSDPISPGSIVSFTMPDVMRTYVDSFAGADGMYYGDAVSAYLLKPVVAVAGDIICRDDNDYFSVNDNVLGKALSKGPNNADLPAWNTCHLLTANEIAVFSDRIQDSIDSRYFGPINIKDVLPYRPFAVIDDPAIR